MRWTNRWVDPRLKNNWLLVLGMRLFQEEEGLLTYIRMRLSDQVRFMLRRLQWLRMSTKTLKGKCTKKSCKDRLRKEMNTGREIWKEGSPQNMVRVEADQWTDNNKKIPLIVMLSQDKQIKLDFFHGSKELHSRRQVSQEDLEMKLARAKILLWTRIKIYLRSCMI